MIASMVLSFLGGLALSIRVFVSLMLLLSARRKLSQLSEFAGVVRNYQLIPDRMVVAAANGIVATEGAVGVALFIWPSSLLPAVAASSLFAVFAVAVMLNLIRGRRDLMCGCDNDGTIAWSVVWRNVFLGCVVSGGAWYGAERLNDVIDWVSAVLCGVSLLGVYEAVHGLLAIGLLVNSPIGSRKMV